MEIKKERLSFFTPKGKKMRMERKIILLVLFLWFASIISFRLFPVITGERISKLLFFNLNLDFWLLGQLLPLFFIILCAAFNLWLDRFMPSESETSLRFRLDDNESNKKRGEF